MRALGVLLVVIFHAFPEALPGGFIGVDIFFVVSGYLISTIIFASLENGSFTYGEFYARRVRRIFPALALVLFSGWLLAWLVMLVDEQQQLGMHLVAGAGFVSNFVLWSEAGYFDSDAYSKPFLHLWSLGIEEQFYILWPLLLAFVWKRKWNFLAITVLVALASFAANVLTVASDPVAAFYAPWSRAWELMIGGMLAWLALHRPRSLTVNADWQSAIGLSLIVAGVVLLDKKAAFPGWWALLPTVGTALMVAAGSSAWLNRKVFGSRLMVSIGLISYPLYLWHWLLLSFAWIARGRMPPPGVRSAWVLLSLVLAYLSYRLLEKPLRAGGPKTALALAAVMATILLIGVATDARLVRPRNDDAAIGPILEALHDWEYPSGFQRTSFAGATVNARKGGAKTVLFIGDSHLEQYGPRVVALLDGDSARYHSAVFLTSAGCSPVPGSAQVNGSHAATCTAFREQVAKLVASPAVSAVVIGAAWNVYLIEASPHVVESGDIDAELRGLENFIRSIAADKKVYLLLDNPSGEQFEPRNFFEGSRLTRLTVKPFQQRIPLDQQQDALRKRLARLAVAAGATVIDPVAQICPDRHCPVMTVDGRPIYKDDNHYRPFYVREYAQFIDVALQD
ncbi:MAG: acyltransferase [Candidatus Accumulibacter sp.]|nr:acyltransferase [Accumulibacter sp.]